MDAKLLRRQWGENIRLARESAEMTQAKLGEVCGVNQSTVAKWEKGLISPGETNKMRLAEILHVEAREMFPLALVAVAGA